MKNQLIGLASSLVLLMGALACSTSSSGTGGSGSTGSTGSTSTSSSTSGAVQMTPAESCAKPGDKGNANGVGQYCTPGGMECTGNYSTTCLADLGAIAGNQWMCTHVGCKADAECGADAYCTKQTGGSACVPTKCGGQGGGTGSGGAGTGGTGGGGGAGGH